MTDIEFLSAAQQLIQKGDFQTAANLAKARLAVQPEFLECRFLLAFCAKNLADDPLAIEQLSEIVKRQPFRKDAQFALAFAYKRVGKLALSFRHLEAFLTSEPRNIQALREAADLALLLGNPSKAMVYALRLTQLAPADLKGWFFYGAAASLLDQLTEAVQAFTRALAISPTDDLSRRALFQLYVRAERTSEAVAVMEEALRISPENTEWMGFLASAYAYAGKSAEAEELFLKAFSEDTANVAGYADYLQEAGRFEESIQILKQSALDHPLQGKAYYQLSEAKDFSLVVEAQSAYASGKLTDDARMNVCYALARARERDSDYEQSYHFLREANELAYATYAAGREYSLEAERVIFEERKRRFNQDALRTRSSSLKIPNPPILIVGMIRSGTTLLDQIISSHPDVESGGELKYWGIEANEWARQSGGQIDDEALRGLHLGYLGELSRVSATKRVSDKMPVNYAHLGLISMCVPNAKILHIQRDPLDTGMSIFSTFLGRGPRWAYNEANIVSNYRLYEEHMDYWSRVLPSGSILHVQYEDLVENSEPTIREILNFCDLDWNERCMRHDDTLKPIRTPSKWQARQPIYRSSIKKYEPYLPYLGSLKSLKKER